MSAADLTTAVLDDYDAQAAELDEVLASLTDAQWAAPSACEGWSVADVVLHLAQSEEGVVPTYETGERDVPFEASPVLDHGDGAVDTWVADMVEAQRTTDYDALLGRWRDARVASMAAMRSADPSRRVTWIATPLTTATLAATRISEHWIHGLDITEALGLDVEDTDRIRHIARLAWRTLPYAFVDSGGDAPTVQLGLVAPSGELWTFGDDGAEVTVEGFASEWCRLAARRLRPSQTTLKTTGELGPKVLELTRTYA